MSNERETWIGADPGGKGHFGVSILKPDGSWYTSTVDCVDEAIDFIRDHVTSDPYGAGVDAPLWWSSGRAGLRKADQWIRNKYTLPSRNVQAVNSLRGAAIAQGMMFVSRIRDIFTNIGVTETHPKAVLRWPGRSQIQKSMPKKISKVGKLEHERDAFISAICAREGFEGRWKTDLAYDRFHCEQDPSKHWLAPVHYFWPE